jgi:hypothetical protein
VTRAERAQEAQALRDQGLIYREIAERMGISRTYAAALITDPTGEKDRARKDSYRGTCRVCGVQTDGSNGRGAAPDECAACRHEREFGERNERIFEAWNRGDTAAVIAEREGMKFFTVLSLVDSHRRRGNDSLRLHRRRNRDLWPLIEERWNEGRTAQEIAEEVGTGDRDIYSMIQTMRKAGIPLRKRCERVAA